MEKEEEPYLLQGEGQQAEQARGAGESVWEQERQRWDTDLRAGAPETGNVSSSVSSSSAFPRT